jgi:hypothetical protein
LKYELYLEMAMTNQENRKHRTFQPERTSVGSWIGMGIVFGVPLGLVVGNLALGIAIGCAVGTAIGVVVMNSTPKNDAVLDQYPRKRDYVLLIGGALVLFGLLTIILVNLILALSIG